LMKCLNEGRRKFLSMFPLKPPTLLAVTMLQYLSEYIENNFSVFLKEKAEDQGLVVKRHRS
jgi:hypothetical protein